MSRCEFTWVNHGETLRCEVDGDHDQYAGDNGGTVDVHVATLTDDGSLNPHLETTGKPYTVTFCDPSLA